MNWNGVKGRYDLLRTGKRRPGVNLDTGDPVGLVYHDTGNLDTTAKNNVDYYKRSYNDQHASAHIFVDDEEFIICIPTTEKAWHVRYDTPVDNRWYGMDINDGFIGVECSYFRDRARTLKAFDNFARVCAHLIDFWYIDIEGWVPGHQDVQAKTDPNNMLGYAGLPKGTATVDQRVKRYLGRVNRDQGGAKKVTVPKNTDKLYRVQTGAFKSFENAQRYKRQVEDKGIDAFTVKEDNLYKIQAGAFSKKANAERMSDRIKVKGFDTYIVHT